MGPHLKNQIVTLTPIVLKHIKSEAKTILPDRRAGQARLMAGDKRARAVRAKVFDEVKAKERKGCACDAKTLFKLIEAITTAIEVVYQTLKAIGAIVDGLYVGS